MLDVEVKLHRPCLPAHAADAKLFALLTLKPATAARSALPRQSVVFVVDTSSSMRAEAVSGRSRIDVVIAGLRDLARSGGMRPDDRVAVVHFDSEAHVLLGFRPASDVRAIEEAIESLNGYSGGTLMAEGMRYALALLDSEETSVARVVLLTDGQTADEDMVHEMAQRLADRNASVFAIGIGTDWNEPLLNMVTERTRGRAFVVLPDAELHGNPIAVAASGFATLLSTEFSRAAREVVTNVVAHVRLARDFVLHRATRVFPALTEIGCESATLGLGNVGTIERTVYVLELNIPARPPGRVRFMQCSFVYDVPGAGYRGEFGPLDLWVEFSTDPARSSVKDDEVFAYVRQRNCDGLIGEAIAALDRGDSARATVLINRAKNMTQQVGNSAMTVLLGRVETELRNGKTISPQSRKTLLVGSKSRTVLVGDDGVGGLSDDEIRRLTGA